MRRLALLVLLTACAQPGMPPGGPPDVSPPKLVRVRPDSDARNVRGNSIAFEFDEVISERPQGAATLADVVVISPSAGTPTVAWHRNTLVVTPRGGLKPNTTYTVELRPGITDLENNVDSTRRVVVFSTGADIASGSIAGTVFDWQAAKPAPQAVVDALVLPDSTRYSTTADSLGAFRLSHIPSGRYTLLALIDQNRNRRLDARESFDSITVVLRDSIRREMLAILRDSLGPGIANVDARDSVTLHVTLDRALDTALTLTPSLFTLKAADSSAVQIRSIISERERDRLSGDSAKRQAVTDSLRRAAAADSARRADSVRAAAAAQPGRPTGRRPGAQTAPPPAATRDTSKRVQILPRAQIPANAVIIEVVTPLPPGASFRLRSIGLRSVTGATRNSDRVFTTPRPRAKSDTGSVHPLREARRRD